MVGVEDTSFTAGQSGRASSKREACGIQLNGCGTSCII
jgi:hypothetical protein